MNAIFTSLVSMFVLAASGLYVCETFWALAHGHYVASVFLSIIAGFAVALYLFLQYEAASECGRVGHM